MVHLSFKRIEIGIIFAAILDYTYDTYELNIDILRKLIDAIDIKAKKSFKVKFNVYVNENALDVKKYKLPKVKK